MKNIRFYKTIKPAVSRLRIAAAGMLFLAAAALAANLIMPPRLPWAVPTVTVGNNPVGIAVDAARHTMYVANALDDTVSVIDSNKCNSRNSSHCTTIATITVGPVPFYLAFDPTTDTIYATLLGPDFDNNTVAVINGATCNATNTSGCGQTPATVTVPGAIVYGLALDTATHTLYVGDLNEGPVSIIDTATCNATNTSGCGQTPVQTAAGGDTITIDYINHGVYVSDFGDSLIQVFNGATCNAGNTSGCGQPPATVVANFNPMQAAVDEATHTVYVPVGSGDGTLGFVLMINGSTCNGTINTGCGNTPNRANVGSGDTDWVLIDPATETVYVQNNFSSSVSVINGATCNATQTNGCANIAPALAVGVQSSFMSFDPSTHSLYASSEYTNRVWVLDASKCNAMHTQGCTKFEPTTTVGAGAWAFADNPDTHTLYETNQAENTVSIIDSAVCNSRHLSGCNQTWPKFDVGNAPSFLAVNRVTNTIYLGNNEDNTLTVINGATCNSSNTSGCTSLATTAVGTTPLQVAVDEATNTIYVVNQDDNTMSVVNGTHCNGTDTSGCGQSWPTAPVGDSPQALTFNPNNRTIYVTNRFDNTVSVINGNACNRITTSGCVPVATVPVGAGPRAVGIVLDRNTVFVANRNDLTVSVIDGATCNGTNTSGCPQAPPPAVLVGAFPDTGGTGNNVLGRSIAVDQHKHIVFIPVAGDSDVATLDGNACRAGHTDACHVKIVNKRIGGFPVTATVDEGSETVYVANFADGTVSLFNIDALPRERPIPHPRP